MTETVAVTRTTSLGVVVGSRDASSGIDRYLGVPYAAAPTHERRFAYPVAHPGWQGVREATSMGATAPQAPYGPVSSRFLAAAEVPGDEYLNLNIWAPEGATGSPVMVWVHGGALAHGSNALDGYDGSAFARDGVVFVSINYRVGVEGFSVLDGAPLNIGLADVVAAFRWVRAEIAAFGGDPANITAVGQSAGATLLWALLARDDARSLMDRAILQSGPPSAAEPPVASRLTRRIAKHLGVPATRAAFAEIPASRLSDAEQTVTHGSTPIGGGLAYSLAIDAELVPRPPLESLRDGAASGIPLLIGLTSEEYRLWLVPTGLVDRLGFLPFALARLRYRVTSRIMRIYRALHPGAARGELLGHLAGDMLIGLPYMKIAKARATRGAPTHFYEFAWRSPVAGLGAAHAVELGFVFDRLDSADWEALSGPDAPQGLADEMHAAWVSFARTGEPGWSGWQEDESIKVFDTEAPAGDTPLVRRLRAWLA
ncbi:carboxylesterase/lipase family protein [Myceligenerans xiligouense]|uniref:Para-nitrobenzyl esterase n=1 Tax=Myceligenerans xiligouense TaxID=253184 RepID=A0A3N4ZB31_9MICO|nr:carboxylesterase family protein [Myceligenerans xiligouense]RPF22652.1 para-nitrobenzyl esterase [Myceligenerans xiligouense]